jgi:hypothetical protein
MRSDMTARKRPRKTDWCAWRERAVHSGGTRALGTAICLSLSAAATKWSYVTGTNAGSMSKTTIPEVSSSIMDGAKSRTIEKHHLWSNLNRVRS